MSIRHRLFFLCLLCYDYTNWKAIGKRKQTTTKRRSTHEMYLPTIKEYLAQPVPDYLISLYAQKRKDLGLPPLSVKEMEKKLKPSHKTLGKYREIACLSIDYRTEKRQNQIANVERATDFIQYCWEMIHLSKVLLRDLKLPENQVYKQLEHQLQSTNLLTLEQFKNHENHRYIKSISTDSR